MKVIVLFVFVLGALSAAGEDFFAKLGGKVTLNCGVSSYTRSLQWYHGTDLLHSVDQFTRRGASDLAQRSVVRQMNLEISSVKETDAKKKFACSADGKRHEHSLSLFSVLVTVHPSAVLKLNDEATLRCEVKGQHQGCEVKWQSPNTKSPTNPSTVQLKSVTSSHSGAWECIVTCGSDTFSQSLTITVQEPPTTTTTTTKSPSKPNGKSEKTCVTCSNNDASPGLLGLAWWVWVAIGVGCLVAILLMVCVIVLCVRVRRRKKRFLKMKGQQRPRHKKYCQCDHPTAAAKPKQGRRREKPSALPLHPA
ncbi:ubiquitin carboxyl-terminal hydrolase 5/13 [Sarotherodon galilaeus]